MKNIRAAVQFIENFLRKIFCRQSAASHGGFVSHGRYEPSIEQLQNIINSIPGGVAVYKVSSIFETVFFSAGVPALTGYTVEEYQELIKHDAAEMTYSEDREMVKSKIRFALENGSIADFSFRKEHRSGEIVWVRLQGVKIGEQDGYPLLQCIFVDIAKEKKALEQLKISQISAEAAIASSKLHYWEYDLEKGDNKNFDNACASLSKGWIDEGKMHNDDIENYRNSLRKIKNGEKEVQLEVRVLNPKTNEYNWKRLTYTNIFDSRGIPVKVAATGEDIDAYKNLESRFTYVMGQNGIYTWEYNIKTHTAYIFGDFVIGGRNTHSIPDMPQSMVEKGQIHPDSIEEVLDMYNKIQNGEKSSACQAMLKMGRDEAWRWYKMDYTTIFDRDNNPIRAIGSAADITEEVGEKRRYEEMMTLHEITFQKSTASYAINISQNKVIRCRSEMPMFLNFSHMSVDGFFQMSRERVIGEACKEAHKAIFDRKNLEQMFYKGVREKAIEAFYRLDGEHERYYKMSITLTQNPASGDLIGFTYATDITKEKLWAGMTNAVGSSYFDFMICINVETQEFLIYYPTKKEIGLKAGYDRIIENEIRKEGKGFKNLPVEDIVEKFKLSNIIKELQDKKEFHFSFAASRDNEKTHCKAHTCTYIDEDKHFITMVRSDFYDVYTAEQKKNNELKQTLRLAEHAISVKTDFLSTMSHDLRTPMNAIIGMSYLGIESMNLEESRDYHKKVNISGKYLLGLINDTLDMSKIDSDKMVLSPQPYFFSEFASSISTLFKSRAEKKGITFTILEVHSTGFAVLADKMRVQQIFVNLINNAIKFTPTGGKVEFIVDVVTRTEEMAEIKYTVRDNGIGMSKDFQNKMFEPFEQEEKTVEENESGTGLGLSIVKRLVDLMHGSITCKSEENKGTEFVVLLSAPMGAKDVKKHNEVRENQNTDILTKKRVLLCEDHPLNIQIATKLLMKKDMLVDCAQNGAQAVNMFTSSAIEYYDLILMDIRMPIMDGIEAAKTIRALDRADAFSVPIIAMTANAFDEDVKKSLEAGMNDHLAKPIEPQRLYEAMAYQIEKAESNSIEV